MFSYENAIWFLCWYCGRNYFVKKYLLKVRTIWNKQTHRCYKEHIACINTLIFMTDTRMYPLKQAFSVSFFFFSPFLLFIYMMNHTTAAQ